MFRIFTWYEQKKKEPLEIFIHPPPPLKKSLSAPPTLPPHSHLHFQQYQTPRPPGALHTAPKELPDVRSSSTDQSDQSGRGVTRGQGQEQEVTFGSLTCAREEAGSGSGWCCSVWRPAWGSSCTHLPWWSPSSGRSLGAPLRRFLGSWAGQRGATGSTRHAAGITHRPPPEIYT